MLREHIPGYQAGLVHGQMNWADTEGPAVKLSANRLIAAVRDGLEMQELEDLRSSFGLPMERLAPKLGLSKATLHRRKAQGKLAPEESDKVLRFARLMGKATAVMESHEAARQWLTSPQHGLGGAAPVDYAETEIGAREVEDLLERIEHGVFA